jgi:hypothetical protein
MAQTWSAVLRIHPGEGRLIALLLAHSFLVGVARIFTMSAAFALFLAQWDATTLPFTYIAIGVVVGLASFTYLKLAGRLPFATLLIGNLCFLLLAVGAVRLGLSWSGNRSLVFGLPILYELLWTLTQLGFWNLAGRLLDVQQGKRLFGLVGAGEPTAIMIGGLLVGPLGTFVGTPNLLLVAMGALLATEVVLVSITRAYARQLAPAAKDVTTEGESSVDLLKNSYVRLLFTSLPLMIVAFFFIDTIFYTQVQAQFANVQALAGFLGVFFAVTGLTQVLSSSMLIGHIMSRYGLRVAILITPVALLLCALLLAFFGTIGMAAVLVFSLAALTKLASKVGVVSITIPTHNVLYQPLSVAQRVQAQTISEGIGYALAVGLAGTMLAVCTTLLGFDSIQLTYVLLAILAAWIAVALLIDREYRTVLLRAITRRKLEGTTLSISDASSFAVVQRELHSTHPEVVIYALRLLEQAEHPSLATMLPALLEHPAPHVRQFVLERIEALGFDAALAAVSRCVAEEPLPSVRGTALRTLAALGGAAQLEQVAAYLDDSELDVRRGALVGLLRSGSIDGVLLAGRSLMELVDAQRRSDRMLAAQVLGDVGVRSFHQPLWSLLHDSDTDVRRAALLAAGNVRHARLWSVVVEAVAVPAVRSAAVRALVAGGNAALPAMSEAMTNPEQSREITILSRLLGHKVCCGLRVFSHLLVPEVL